MELRDTLINTVLDKLLIGSVLVFMSYKLNSTIDKFRLLQAKQLEGWKSDLSAKADEGRRARSAIDDLGKALSSALDSITKLTWEASQDLKPQALSNYEDEMRKHLASIVSARVSLAVADVVSYQDLDTFVNDVFELDIEICKMRKDADWDRVTRTLIGLHHRARGFEEALPNKIFEVVDSFNKRHAHAMAAVA
jgi:hypothetical protein